MFAETLLERLLKEVRPMNHTISMHTAAGALTSFHSSQGSNNENSPEPTTIRKPAPEKDIVSPVLQYIKQTSKNFEFFLNFLQNY